MPLPHVYQIVASRAHVPHGRGMRKLPRFGGLLSCKRLLAAGAAELLREIGGGYTLVNRANSCSRYRQNRRPIAVIAKAGAVARLSAASAAGGRITLGPRPWFAPIRRLDRRPRGARSRSPRSQRSCWRCRSHPAARRTRASSADPFAAADPVVARVNGVDIKQSDLDAGRGGRRRRACSTASPESQARVAHHLSRRHHPGRAGGREEEARRHRRTSSGGSPSCATSC